MPETVTQKPRTVRPLYPDRVIVADRRRALRGIAAFLLKYGYWPATKEQALMMRCSHGALVFYLKELSAMGLVQRNHRVAARGYYELLPKGWLALGLKAIEPWVRRPRRLLTRIAHKVTIDLYDLEHGNKSPLGT